MALLWWAWFRVGSELKDRAHLVATLLGCVLALGLGRALVNLLPHRLRPLHEPALQLATPYGVAEGALGDLSSFPSDHAVLFFALAIGFFFVARWLGWLALTYVSLFIALPRLFLGLHYLSDIVVGAIIGIVVCALANGVLGRTGMVRSVLGWSQRSPALFYPLTFLVSYQIADLFEDSRLLVKGLGALIKHAA
jgi:undecaprenyl-diphosphatase